MVTNIIYLNQLVYESKKFDEFGFMWLKYNSIENN